MSRKKKETEKIEYPWSPYQLAIYDWIEHEQGHLVVEAAAGSGKSTTLVKCLDFIPEGNKVLLTAFNTDIVNELKKKTKERENVEVRTLHGLGLLFIKKNLPQKSAIPEPGLPRTDWHQQSLLQKRSVPRKQQKHFPFPEIPHHPCQQCVQISH